MTASLCAGVVPSTRITSGLLGSGLYTWEIGDVGLLQILLNLRHGVVGLGIHRLRHLHLQDQVRAALQIQAQMNPAGYGAQQRLSADPGWNSEDSIEANQQNRNDQGNLVS